MPKPNNQHMRRRYFPGNEIFLMGKYCTLLLCFFLAISCASPSKAKYFNGIQEGNYANRYGNPNPQINPGDILSITVSSLNPEASAIFNSPITSIPVSNNPDMVERLTGYLVNPEGKITFPVLGELNAAGQTKKDLTDSITHFLKERKLLVDPIVSIRIMNYRVTVLGEVGRPGVIEVPSERISVLEAIGYAGDLTLYAKRDNVLLIRYEEERKIVKRLDLNSDLILSSPYYFLKANDVIYVESNKAKVQSTSRMNQLLPAILSGMAFLAVIFDRFTR